MDEFVIDELARKAKITPGWLSAIESEASSTLLGVISGIVSEGLFYRTASAPGEGFERKKYIAFLNRIMKSMAKEGGYVLVGRGSQFILKDHRRAVHLMLVGEYEDRVKFVMERYDLLRSEAEALIKEKEKQRAAIASNIFEANIDDVSLYHLVINTSRTPFDCAVDSVSCLVAQIL